MLPRLFPYFGSKSSIAADVWAVLGDPHVYVEPFAGTASVLLARPTAGRTEILSDADPWLVNLWRTLQREPLELIPEFDGWPVSEVDLHARQAWLAAGMGAAAEMARDPGWHDPVAAARFLYVMTCSMVPTQGTGPWVLAGGRLVRGAPGSGISRGLPTLSDARRGVLGMGNLPEVLLAHQSRLRGVEVLCGDWSEAIPASGDAAVLLDPPYEVCGDLYAHGDGSVSGAVRAWCRDRMPAGWRVVLCGYGSEHDALLEHGWRSTAGRAANSGFGAVFAASRERVWWSPACVPVEQGSLF